MTDRLSLFFFILLHHSIHTLPLPSLPLPCPPFSPSSYPPGLKLLLLTILSSAISPPTLSFFPSFFLPSRPYTPSSYHSFPSHHSHHPILLPLLLPTLSPLHSFVLPLFPLPSLPLPYPPSPPSSYPLTPTLPSPSPSFPYPNSLYPPFLSLPFGLSVQFLLFIYFLDPMFIQNSHQNVKTLVMYHPSTFPGSHLLYKDPKFPRFLLSQHCRCHSKSYMACARK